MIGEMFKTIPQSIKLKDIKVLDGYGETFKIIAFRTSMAIKLEKFDTTL